MVVVCYPWIVYCGTDLIGSVPGLLGVYALKIPDATGYDGIKNEKFTCSNSGGLWNIHLFDLEALYGLYCQ